MNNRVCIPADGDWAGLRRALALLMYSRLSEDSTQSYANLVLTGLTASRLMYTDATKTLSSVANLASWISGGTGITVTDDGDGTITITAPSSHDAVTISDTASIDLSITGQLLSAAVLPAGVDHNSLNNYAANRHFLQTDITAVSTALSTGILKVTTGTGALSVIADNSSTWDAAQPSHANLTSLSGLTFASTAFVKMTAAGTFGLDTSVYYKSGDSPSFVGLSCTGNIDTTAGELHSGVQDTVRGYCRLYGNATGNHYGGTLYLETAADYDTTVDAYILTAFDDYFAISNGGASNLLKISATGALQLPSYTAGLLLSDASGNVTLDTSSYLTSESDPVAMGYIDQSVKQAATPQFARLYIDGAGSYIDTDGSSNMIFVDAVTGSKTLAQLAAGGGFDINALTVKSVPDRTLDYMPIYSGADSDNRKLLLNDLRFTPKSLYATQWVIFPMWSSTVWTTSATGTATTALKLPRITFDTGATSSSVSKAYTNLSLTFNNNGSAGRWKTKFILSSPVAWTNSTRYVGFYVSTSTVTDTTQHVGFKMVNTRLWCSSGNGTNGAQTDTGIDLVAGTYNLYFEYNFSEINYYLETDTALTLLATHSTYRPAVASEGTGNTDLYTVIQVTNSSSSNRTLWVNLINCWTDNS